MSGSSMITRGRVALITPRGGVVVIVDPGRLYGGGMIEAQPVPEDERPAVDSIVYVEIEVPSDLGRHPAWARIVDRPSPMAKPVVQANRETGAGESRQFVVKVLDVAQGAGALLQVDDEPPRWLSANDSLAVDVPVLSPDTMLRRQLDDATAEVARLAREVQELRDLGAIWPLRQRLAEQQRQIDELREDLERRDGQVGRAVALARAIWSPDRGLRQGMPDWLFKSSAQWPDVVRWVSDPPAVDELDLAGRPDPSQDEGRTPIAAGWGRERSTLWVCPRCEQQHAIIGDTWLDCACGARYQFVYGGDPEDKPASEVTAGEVEGWRWWRVEDAPDDDWLVYDNRPMVEDWEATSFEQTGVLGLRRPCPKLVQGRVPWAVVREAIGP
jgi:hypothetical protein